MAVYLIFLEGDADHDDPVVVVDHDTDDVDDDSVCGSLSYC